MFICVQYLFLDGNNLNSTKLVNLGQGRYKIKVCEFDMVQILHDWYVIHIDVSFEITLIL